MKVARLKEPVVGQSRHPFPREPVFLATPPKRAVIVSWEVILSKGQEWDWLGDSFWRVQTLAFFFAVGLAGLIFWELRHPNPIVNFRPLRERSFSSCCIIIFFAYAVLYGASTSLPGLLQALFGYDALNGGWSCRPLGSLRYLRCRSWPACLAVGRTPDGSSPQGCF
jgi:hypothetical protein